MLWPKTLTICSTVVFSRSNAPPPSWQHCLSCPLVIALLRCMPPGFCNLLTYYP